MARRTPLLALLFALALALTACPEDVEEAVEDDQPTEPIEQVRDAASNTLGQGTAQVTVNLAGDDNGADAADPADDATTEDDDTTIEDDDEGLEGDDEATTEDDGEGLEGDDEATTEDDDLETTGDDDLGATADDDEIELTGDEDFGADQRHLTASNGQDGQIEFIVDGTDLYVLMNGEAGTTDDLTGTADDDATPATEEDDDEGLEGDDEATTEDDDEATTEDDEGATEDDAAADEEWGWFDLTQLTDDNGAEGDDEAATEDDDDQAASTGTTADDELERFPFRDSHLVLQVLEDVEGDVNEGQDDNGEDWEGTLYEVAVDVEQTETTDDAQEWLERISEGQSQFQITVWIDDEYVVQVEYQHGADDDVTAPEDDTATTEDDDAATDDDDTTTEDDDAATDDDDTTATDDDGTTGTDDDTTATTDEGALTVTIEYSNLGEEVEIELPEDDQVVEIDEDELRQLLPTLPGDTAGTTDGATTG